jgi:hypothetical protein
VAASICLQSLLLLQVKSLVQGDDKLSAVIFRTANLDLAAQQCINNAEYG